MKTPDKTMMHATDWAGQDPTGWIVQEKFDGHFARWTGTRLLTREGVDYNAPEWFTRGLPAFPLDCEIWAGKGKRHSVNGAPRWIDKNRWCYCVLVAFDAPEAAGDYPARWNAIAEAVPSRPGLLVPIWWRSEGPTSLAVELDAFKSAGSEGLVIRKPDAAYTVGRVETMLKVINPLTLNP